MCVSLVQIKEDVKTLLLDISMISRPIHVRGLHIQDVEEMTTISRQWRGVEVLAKNPVPCFQNKGIRICLYLEKNHPLIHNL
jgi:hypothetical protein